MDSNSKCLKDCPELYEACNRYPHYNLFNIKRFKYKKVPTVLQEGPQCGIVALAMCCKDASKENVNKILEEAKACDYTINGEMFSCNYLLKLAKTNLTNKLELYDGNLNSKYIVNFLLEGGLILVPYDNDKNFTPCLNKGHTAHWALICGILVTDETFVLAKHGKSKRLAIWPLDDLARSNGQLKEFSPDRKLSNVEYKLPNGGISGPEGISGKCILIYL